jgi:hypothetical protein
MSDVLSFDGKPESREALLSALRTRGYARIRPTVAGLDARGAALAPWEAAELVLGPVALVEQQPIAPVPWGRSFAATSRETPLHSDSQLWRGVPPHVQLMFCDRAAAEGGETLLCDTWDLLDRIERTDGALLSELFDRTRSISFVFGDVFGPTVCLRGGSLVFTHSPRREPSDPVAARLAEFIASTPLARVRVLDGEVLVADNHRLLHGRTAFSDGRRHFTRLLAWLPAPLGSPARWVARARRVVEEPALPSETAVRRRAVIDLLRGVPPGVLAARLGVSEPILYAWRDCALAATERALGARET